MLRVREPPAVRVPGSHPACPRFVRGWTSTIPPRLQKITSYAPGSKNYGNPFHRGQTRTRALWRRPLQDPPTARDVCPQSVPGLSSVVVAYLQPEWHKEAISEFLSWSDFLYTYEVEPCQFFWSYDQYSRMLAQGNFAISPPLMVLMGSGKSRKAYPGGEATL